jgi:hypothetical protein
MAGVAIASIKSPINTNPNFFILSSPPELILNESDRVGSVDVGAITPFQVDRSASVRK